MNKNPVLPSISSQVLDSRQYMAPGTIPAIINQPSKPCIKPKGSLLIVAVFLLVLSTTVIVFFALGEASSKSIISGPIQLTRTHINSTNKTQVSSKDNFACGVQSVSPHLRRRLRIIKGVEAAQKSWPWAVSIGFDGPEKSIKHTCGGTLISKRIVVTAAHCVYPQSVFDLVGQPVAGENVSSMIRLYIGMTTASKDINADRTYKATKIIAHPDFDTTKYTNDVSVILLDRDVNESDETGFICLDRKDSTKPGTRAYAVGWGSTSVSTKIASDKLMQVSFEIKSQTNCGLSYEPAVQFCAGDHRLKKDTCYGDSGGPLMTVGENNRFVFTGVVSFGDQACSGRGVYTNISNYYDWIVDNSHF